MRTLLLVCCILLAGCSWSIIPACQEDAVIVGQGDFVEGYWTEYVCGPSLDDFEVD
jgi:hypothetical protein